MFLNLNKIKKRKKKHIKKDAITQKGDLLTPPIFNYRYWMAVVIGNSSNNFYCPQNKFICSKINLNVSLPSPLYVNIYLQWSLSIGVYILSTYIVQIIAYIV